MKSLVILITIVLSTQAFADSNEQTEMKTYKLSEVSQKISENEEVATNWDENQKDIFHMEVKFRSVSYLSEKYPEIQRSKFSALKNSLGDY